MDCMGGSSTPRRNDDATNDVDSETASCHTESVPDSAVRSDERDERPLESFFHAQQHGNDYSPGRNPSDFAAIVRRDRDTTS